MKNVPLIPVNPVRAQQYTASTSPLYNEATWDYAYKNQQTDYYSYLINQATEKGLDSSILEGLDDPEDQLTKLYRHTIADTSESKEWDLQIPNEEGNVQNFVGTEAEYLDKILQLRQEYKQWETDRAIEQAKKDAMNGWEKAGTSIASILGNVAIGGEQFLAGFAEFIAGGATWLWGGVTKGDWSKTSYKDIGLTEGVDWQAEQLANFERLYTNYRDIYGNLTTEGKIVTTIAQGIGQQLPTAVMNMVVPGSGYALLYAGSAAGSLNEYITKSDTPVWQAAIKVAISTGFEMAIEKGLGKLWGQTGADIVKYGKSAESVAARELAKSITTKEGAKLLGKAALRGVKDVAQESLEEFLQEWSNIAVDMIAAKINTGFQSDIEDLLNEDGQFSVSKAFERTLYAGLAGAAGAGFFGGIGKIHQERAISKSLQQATGYKASIFDSEYQVTENGQTRKLNFFEKIALQTNIKGIYERVQMAQSNGALSQQQRTEIWENVVMLGDFFNTLTQEDIDKSLKLFNEIHNYAEEQGKKLRTIQQSSTGTLIGRVTENMLSSTSSKTLLAQQETTRVEQEKYYSGEMDIVFGTTLLQRLYGAKETARSKGLEESRARRAERKAKKTEVVETTTTAQETATTVEEKARAAFETSQRTDDEIVSAINKQWSMRSAGEIYAEIQAIQSRERDYTAQEAQLAINTLKRLWEEKQPKKDLFQKTKKKLSKKEQRELEKQEKEQERQEAKERAEEERKAKEEAYDSAIEQYEKASLTKLLKAKEALLGTKDSLEQEQLRAIEDLYNEKLQEELSKDENKVTTIQGKYKDLSEDELVEKIDSLKKKALSAKAGLSNIIEYEVARGMMSSFREYNDLLDGLYADAYNAKQFTYEQNKRRQSFGDREDLTWAETEFVLYGEGWQKLNESLSNTETQEQLANDLVTEVNSLMEGYEEITSTEDSSSKKSFLSLNTDIEKGGRKAYLTNGDKVITDTAVVYIPNKALADGNIDFIMEQLIEEDIINKCVETYLAPIEQGLDKKATKYEKDQYKLFAKMKDAFFSQFSNLTPEEGESNNHFFVRMLFTDIGPYSAIKRLLPSEYRKSIQMILTSVIGLEKELGKFGDAYQKRGHEIFETFQGAAVKWLTQNFAIYYRNMETIYANPQDFVNLLKPEQVRYIIQQRKSIPVYTDGASFVSQSKVENPQIMTNEDTRIQLKNMGEQNRFALDILQVVEGKKRYQVLSEDNPVRSFWNNTQEQNAELDKLIASNKAGNEVFPRASKTIIENATEEQVNILKNTTLGYSNIVPGYLVANSSNQEQATTNGYTIVIENFKYEDRYYAPIVNEAGEARYVYAWDQRYEVVEHDEKNKRIVIVPKEDFRAEKDIGFETTADSLSLWPEHDEILNKYKEWNFPRFSKTTFPFIEGKSTSLADLLRSNLSDVTKEKITVTDMINYAGDLLSEDFKAEIGLLTNANVYQAIQNYLLENSNEQLSLVMDRSTNSYYVANAAPVNYFLDASTRKTLEVDPDGTSITRTFREIADRNEGENFFRIKDRFPLLGEKIPAIGEIKIYPHKIISDNSAYGETTTGLEYMDVKESKQHLGEALIEEETIREPKIDIFFRDNTTNGHLMFILAHEIQHILQDHFGWVWGSNDKINVPSSVKEFIDKTPAYKANYEGWFRYLVADQYQEELKKFTGDEREEEIDKIIEEHKDYLENEYSNRAYQMVVYTNNIGEIQANMEMPAANGLGFVTLIEPNGKINIMTPDGRIHYGEYLDQDIVTKYAPKSSFIDVGWWQSLDADERKQSRSTTNIKRTNEIFQKYYEGKRKRLDKRVQGFLEDIQTEENLNKLPRDLAALIREDAATYDDLIAWFKQAKDIDEDTFKLFVDNIFPGTEIKTFEELEELTLKLGYAIDEQGNIQLDSKGNPKENIYRNRGQTFSPDFNKYRAALMEHYDPSQGLKGMQKYVRAAEYLGRQIVASDIKADEEDKREFGDESQTTETLEGQIFGERERLEKQVAKYVALQEREKYKRGEITEEQMNKKLAKLRPNADGDIELFDKFSDKQLKSMYYQLVKQQTAKLGGVEAAERKIEEAESTREIKNQKQLDTEKATRRQLRKVSEILGFMTEEEIKEVLGDDAQYFKLGEDGKYHYQVSGKYSLTENVQAAREKFLNRVLPKVNEWRYKQKGRKEAYIQEQRVKAEQKRMEEQKKKVEVKAIETNKVAPVNNISFKVGDKVINITSTTNQVPKVLQKIFNNIFSKESLKNAKEEHYSNDNMKEFMQKNGIEIVNMDTQDWLAVLEFFEQSNIERDGPEANAYRAARLYTLFSMVILMKTGRTVMNKDYVNRANNLMQKASMTTMESNAWKNLMLRTQGKNIVTQTHSFIPAKVQEEFESALTTSVDGSDENFAKAVVNLKKAVQEEAEEARSKKSKVESVWEKVLSFRYTAMLSSPMTWFRNAFSNRVVRLMNGWSEKIGNALVGNKIPIDKFTEKIVRYENRQVFDEVARVPIVGKKQGDYILVGTKVKSEVSKWINENLIKNNLLHELTEGYSKYDPDKRMNQLTGVNYIVETLIDNYRKQYNLDHTFKTKFFNVFHKFVTKMISDEKFINEATLRYFGKMLTEDIDKGRLDENRLMKSDLLDAQVSEIFAKAQWLAFTDYMRNGNFVTKWLSELGKGDNFFAKYAIPLVAPFAQSSVNWWVETMRYSPFGLGKAIINLVKYDKYIAKQDQKRAVRGEIATPEGFDRYLLVRNVGKGVLGTMLWAIGFGLGALGIAGLNKKGDKYVLYIGDKIELDISNYFNTSSVLAGIATIDTIKKVAKGESKNWMSILSNMLNAYGETLFLSDLLGEYRYSNGIGDYVMDLPYNFIYSMVPNIMKLTSNLTHVGKTSYSSGFLGDLQRLLAGIPGVPYLLDQWAGVEVDPYTGKKYNPIGIVENAFKQFGFGNTGKNYFGISEVEREAIKHNIKIGNLTGSITVDDKQYNLNKTQLNETAGEYVNQLVSQLLDGRLRYNNKSYGKMTDEEQTAAIKYYINKAREYAKIATWTSAGHKYYASQEMFSTLKSLGISNVYLGNKGYVV